MNTCRTCKHWVREPKNDSRFYDWEFINSGLFPCAAIVEWFRIVDDSYSSNSTEKNWAENRHKKLQEAKAVVTDGSQFMASLITAGDFGCVKWEEYSDEVSRFGNGRDMET